MICQRNLLHILFLAVELSKVFPSQLVTKSWIWSLQLNTKLDYFNVSMQRCNFDTSFISNEFLKNKNILVAKGHYINRSLVPTLLSYFLPNIWNIIGVSIRLTWSMITQLPIRHEIITNENNLLSKKTSKLDWFYNLREHMSVKA